MADRDFVADAEELKVKGNEYLAAKDFDMAIRYYTEALKLHQNHVYYSNRSAAYLSKGFAETALKDADECIRMKPEWAKGYSRKGAALHKLRKYKDSIAAYEEGLKVDPNNAALKQGLESVQAEASGPPPGAAGGAAGNPMASMFGPDMFDKLKANPKTAAYLEDAEFVKTLNALQSNPNLLQMYMRDQRVMDCMGALMGIDLSAMQQQAEESKEAAEKRKADELAAKKKKEEEEKKRKEDEEKAKYDALPDEVKQALKHKEQGNEHYKKREFAEALKEYEAAIKLNPTEMTLYTNKAAVLLEDGDLEGCIKSCEEAVKVGRENNAGYEAVAKAYARMGNAYFKNKRWAEAIKHYEDAQLEASSPDVARRLKKAQVNLKKEQEKAYIDPEKAVEAKARGNEKFKASDYPGAIEEYTEAVKRDPTNAVYYANRAAAYTKMMDFGRANDDCNKALELDPKYIKAYSRRGAIEFFRKEYHLAIETYQKGLEIDPENAELKEGLQKTMFAIQSGNGESNEQRAQRAMEDPEIRSIMSDPVMNQVLRDMQADPASAQKHMSNPSVAAKINKLIAAGIIQTK